LSAELNRRGIAATKASDDAANTRYRLDVSASAVEAAVDTLATTRSTPPAADADSALDDGPLIPTRSEQRERASRVLALDLARSIELLPGVLRARVHLTLPAADTRLMDLTTPTPAAAPSAAVMLLRASSAGPAVVPVRALLAAAVPGLTPQAVHVIETVQKQSSVQCAQLTRVGPVGVTRASAGTLKVWLGVSLVAHMLLASTLLFVLTRKRRKPGEQPPL
jgi:type III secretory pathway lipoprotein EscJ